MVKPSPKLSKKPTQVMLTDPEQAEIDRARGLVPRAAFMRAAALKEARVKKSANG